ncbi:DUF2272 domain-containing protein [Luteimonas vadosa]|uniref:DUF2272 domain-containing protein n=1 Tax=Luteimonas vadosa TaxID=1165507 RepID=A0ABP9E226_9GAMM
MTRLLPLLLLLVSGLVAAVPAKAADPCPRLRHQKGDPEVATRIAAWACEASQNWYAPFIDLDGKVNGVRTYEAEATPLANSVQAWQQVAIYWNDSNLLSSAYGRAGASSCAYANASRTPSASCRAFVIDTPWSAAFVSWVMLRAGVPGFKGSSSHVNYVRDAYRSPADSAYRIHDPQAARPEPGDLLCYVRVPSRIFGYAALAGLLSSPDGEGLGMHCDIVVGTVPGNRAYLVGGNVAQAVTLRMLRLAPNGYFASLPMRSASDAPCTPDSPEGCNSNRQDWSALLKLRPEAELARLPQPYVPPASQVLPPTPAPAQCCVNCVVGSGIPRCPAGTVPPRSSPDPGKRLPLQAPPAAAPPQCCVNCVVGSEVPRCPAPGTTPSSP